MSTWNLAIANAVVATAGHNLVAAIYDASAPSVVIQSLVVPSPYDGTTKNITFLGVDPIVYNFKLFESIDTTPSGSLRCIFSLQPTVETTQIRASLFLVADTSPGFTSGTNTYTDSSLSGWSYDLERVGFGTQQPVYEYTSDDTSFTLAVEGDVFNSGEKFVLHFLPIVSSSSPTISTTNIYSDFVVLTGDTTIDNTYASKVILLQGSSAAFTVTLPALSAVSIFKLFTFFSDGGSHINVSLVCAGSDTIQFGGTTVTKLILGQGEKLKLLKFNNIWNIEFVSDTVKTVGELFYSYKTTELNTVFANGSLLLRASYPRLWAWVQTLATGLLVSDGTWASSTIVDGTTYFLNHGLYSTGNGSTTFRIPKLYDNSFFRNVDGSTRVAGSGAVETIRKHNHTMHAFGTIPNLGYYLTNSTNRYSGGGGDGLGGQSSPNTTMRTGNDNGAGQSSPSETVPTNTGVYALIRI